MREYIKKHWFVTTLLFVALAASAAKVGDDLFKIGKPGSSANKVLKLGDTREIRSNEADGTLEFTVDGTNYKKIGSGSGGGSGINLLSDFNFDFEAGVGSWTASGGTLVAETGSPLFGEGSGSWDSNASSQTLESTLVTIEEGMKGLTCNAHLFYKYPSGS